jgi:hypothetical protein
VLSCSLATVTSFNKVPTLAIVVMQMLAADPPDTVCTGVVDNGVTHAVSAARRS